MILMEHPRAGELACVRNDECLSEDDEQIHRVPLLNARAYAPMSAGGGLALDPPPSAERSQSGVVKGVEPAVLTV